MGQIENNKTRKSTIWLTCEAAFGELRNDSYLPDVVCLSPLDTGFCGDPIAPPLMLPISMISSALSASPLGELDYEQNKRSSAGHFDAALRNL
jgi:hypothetical protein